MSMWKKGNGGLAVDESDAMKSRAYRRWVWKKFALGLETFRAFELRMKEKICE